MSEEKPTRCICGRGNPKVEMETNFYGGGRYKGATRKESWDVFCRNSKCDNRTTKYHATEEEAIVAWNRDIIRQRARRDAKDKLVHDLEHSSGGLRYCSTRNVDRALARLLKDVQDIKERIAALTADKE